MGSTVFVMNRGTLISIFILSICAALLAFFTPTNASGVSVSLSDGAGTADAGSGGQVEIAASWTSSGFYATGTEIALSITPATSSTIVDCAAPSDSFGAESSGAFGSFTSSSAAFTLTESVATGTSGSLCLSFGLTTTTATNYTIRVLATSSTTEFTTTDFGAALYYVLGGNEVRVTAEIPSSISFSIRNSDDSANTNVCELGILSLSEVSYCSYRLRIATNASSGFTATLQPDGPFDIEGIETMTSITNDAAFSAGTEAYGIALFIGATTGGRDGSTGFFSQPAIEAGSSVDPSLTFDVDATPLDFTTAATVLSYGGSFNPEPPPSTETTSLVVHGAAIGAGTTAGTYTQTITYRVTGSF